jgi:two-component system sensor histidine kinase YcbA
MGYSTKFDYVTGNIYRGVGLCGVKSTIEEQFGGSIEVDSVFGDGTQFTIKVPKEAISFDKESVTP